MEMAPPKNFGFLPLPSLLLFSASMSESNDLVVWLETVDGQRYPIVGTCTLGRSASNQIVLVGETISRRHSLVHAQDQHEYSLVDLGSGNGTYLNGRRVTHPTMLRDGDLIEIGPNRMTFRRPAEKTEERQSDGGATILEIKMTKCWMLIADIEGSTHLSQTLSAEELPMVTGRWLAECKQVIEECGGSINKFLGDGFFAYWHEREKTVTDVARAIAALKQMQDQAKPPFRVVVHFGRVSTGGSASLGEESLSGLEVNFVFRMEKLAGKLKEQRFLSEKAAVLLQAVITAEPIGQHPVDSFEGRFTFHRC